MYFMNYMQQIFWHNKRKVAERTIKDLTKIANKIKEKTKFQTSIRVSSYMDF